MGVSYSRETSPEEPPRSDCDCGQPRCVPVRVCPSTLHSLASPSSSNDSHLPPPPRPAPVRSPVAQATFKEVEPGAQPKHELDDEQSDDEPVADAHSLTPELRPSPQSLVNAPSLGATGQENGVRGEQAAERASVRCASASPAPSPFLPRPSFSSNDLPTTPDEADPASYAGFEPKNEQREPSESIEDGEQDEEDRARIVTPAPMRAPAVEEDEEDEKKTPPRPRQNSQTASPRRRRRTSAPSPSQSPCKPIEPACRAAPPTPASSSSSRPADSASVAPPPPPTNRSSYDTADGLHYMSDRALANEEVDELEQTDEERVEPVASASGSVQPRPAERSDASRDGAAGLALPQAASAFYSPSATPRPAPSAPVRRRSTRATATSSGSQPQLRQSQAAAAPAPSQPRPPTASQPRPAPASQPRPAPASQSPSSADSTPRPPPSPALSGPRRTAGEPPFQPHLQFNTLGGFLRDADSTSFTPAVLTRLCESIALDAPLAPLLVRVLTERAALLAQLSSVDAATGHAPLSPALAARALDLLLAERRAEERRRAEALAAQARAASQQRASPAQAVQAAPPPTAATQAQAHSAAQVRAQAQAPSSAGKEKEREQEKPHKGATEKKGKKRARKAYEQQEQARDKKKQRKAEAKDATYEPSGAGADDEVDVVEASQRPTRAVRGLKK
ncbi:hypothetical protein JCM10207_008833 [Rhodosporidiobolus poonsookiae]